MTLENGVYLMANRRRTHTELLSLLEDEVYFLQSGSERYDAGKIIEAKQLSTRLRILLHQTNKSHALINQLRLNDQLTWVDTAGLVDLTNLHPKESCLTLTKVTAGPQATKEFVPKCDVPALPPVRDKNGREVEAGGRIPFDEWWNNPVVRDATTAAMYSRSQLVLALANQEGGAHYDPKIRAAYAAIVESDWLSWVIVTGSSDAPKPYSDNPVMASVRQIAWEVLESIRQQRAVIDASTGAAT